VISVTKVIGLVDLAEDIRGIEIIDEADLDLH
jgi:hypothetical protein